MVSPRWIGAVAVLVALCGLGAQRFTTEIQVGDVAFIDEFHGWVSVSQPTPSIFRTSDGGRTWIRMPLAVKAGLSRICFLNTTTGLGIQYVSDNESAIYRTVDGGRTWTKVSSIKEPYLSITDVKFIGADKALMVGERSLGRGWVAELSDEGRTLHVRDDLPVDFRTQSNTLGILDDGSTNLWIVGKELILHSSDNGKNWENQASNAVPGIDLGIGGVALPGGRAWIVAGNFDIYRTQDYGGHWVKALTTEDNGEINFDSISFFNVNDGCAVGNSSFIYCTNNGGATWSRSRVFKTFPNGSPFRSKLQLFRSAHGWASVDGALYKTEDGGRSFAEVLTASGPTESSVPGEFQGLKTSINGPTELAYNKDGSLFIVEAMQGRLLRLNTKNNSIKVMLPEPETHYQDFDSPNAIAADQEGNLLIADFNGRLRKLDPRSGDTTVLLPASPSPSGASLDVPAEMTIDGMENVLIVDRHHRLFRWRPEAGRLETVAGTGVGGFGGDGALAADAQLQFPEGVAVNKGGDIFIADYANCRIRKIDAETQIITTFAGTGECASRGDGGLAIKAALNYPQSIALDSVGNLFVVDSERVRRIDRQGVITTYAGTGQQGFSGDGGPANRAKLANPSGLAVDEKGNLFISEYVNNRIRRVDAKTKIITTVAGNGLPHRVETAE